jgi:hypothetical protein
MNLVSWSAGVHLHQAKLQAGRCTTEQIRDQLGTTEEGSQLIATGTPG